MNFELLKTKAQEAGIKDLDINIVKEDGQTISLFNGNVENNKSYSKTEITVRGIYNDHIASVYVEDDKDSEIDFIISSIKNNCNIIKSNEPYFMYEGDKIYPSVEKSKVDLNSFTQDKVITLLKDLTKYAKEYSNLVQMVQAGYGMSLQEFELKNTKGLNLKRQTLELEIFLAVVVKNENDTRQSYVVLKPTTITDIDYEKINKMIDMAIKSLNATSIPSRVCKTILSNDVASTLLACFNQMFTADNVLKNLSLLKDKLNEKVFGQNITIIDNPILEEATIKYPFDDEGVATSSKTLIENGILKGYLHNLSTSCQTNTKSTGNGFKSNTGKIGVAPKNIYLKPSNITFDEMLSSVDDGIYITDVMGQHAGVNPVSGDFNLQSSGFLIENGKITKPVTLIIISGNIIKLLNDVLSIANDIEYDKDFSSPSLLIKSLAISGK